MRRTTFVITSVIRAGSLAAALAALAVLAAPAHAESTGDGGHGGKRSVIRTCDADAKQLCADVLGAGDRKPIVKCLADNRDKLAPACLRALRRARRVSAFRHACAADWKAKCVDTKPTGGGKNGAIIQCLRQNEATLSPDCQARIAKRKTKKGQQDVAAVANEAIGEEQSAAAPIDEVLVSIPEEPAVEPAGTDVGTPPLAQ